MIKGTEKEFVKLFMPLILEVWDNEQVPSAWNRGVITSIYKGKGDKECLANHRGITVSSSPGGILEEVIDRRVEKIVKVTQGQAGGKKGASTVDHLFLLRGIMTIAIKKKQNVFLTFYDVAKAYDRADVKNMLHIIWKAGVQGKMWRLLKAFSENLTAVIKTRYGPTRPIKRVNGGRQGSQLMGRLFSKQMDVLSEKFIDEYDEGIKINEELTIGVLEFVDDVLSGTIGIKNQQQVLNKVDEFAKMNKLEWGESKCEVMQCGRKVAAPDEWKLGEKNIKNTAEYKYLGDTITNDNKNKINLQKRENNLQATTRQINTTASSDVMRGIETRVILELYEKCVIPSFLNNAESWTLTLTEERQIDKVCIQAVKRLFNLPSTTPSPAIIHSFGLLYATQILDQKRLLYLHKLLTRESTHWTFLMLTHLKTQGIGWAENIQEKLTTYGLEMNWDVIKTKTKPQWKDEVTRAVNKFNGKKLLESCSSQTPTGTKINSKTNYIHEKLLSTQYIRKPLEELTKRNKQQAKTIILSRNRMLTCGRNYKGTMNQICQDCNMMDDENHRLNECAVWEDVNFIKNSIKPNFDDIFSENDDILNEIIEKIENVWELKYANGRMKRM